MRSCFFVISLIFLHLFLSSCDEDILGCMDQKACNFNSQASGSIEGSCFFPPTNFDCDNTCLSDTDSDGVCDLTLDKDFKEGDLLKVPDGLIYKNSDEATVSDLRHRFLESVFTEKEEINFYLIDQFPGDDKVASKVNRFLKEQESRNILVIRPSSEARNEGTIRSYALKDKTVSYSPLNDGEYVVFRAGETYIKASRSNETALFSIGDTLGALTEGYVFNLSSSHAYELPVTTNQSLSLYLGGVTVLFGDSLCDKEKLSCKSEGMKFLGCTNKKACNYDSQATYDDGTCRIPAEHYSCDGRCIKDSDGDKVCDAFEVSGCFDKTACNHNKLVTDHDDSLCEYEKSWYSDEEDKDSLGDSSKSLEACDQPKNYVEDSTDINPDCHSDITDVCGVCNGPGLLTFYADEDGDSKGNEDESEEACVASDGYVSSSDDTCPFDSANDADGDEVCGCTLDDCTEVDVYDYCEDDPEDQGVKWFLDRDGDESGDIDADPLRVCDDPSTDELSYVTNQDDACPNNVTLQADDSIDTDYDQIDDCYDLCMNDWFNDSDSDEVCYCTLLDCSSLESYDVCPNDSELTEDGDADEDDIPDCVDECSEGYSFSLKSEPVKVISKEKILEETALSHYVFKLNPSFVDRSRVYLTEKGLETGSENLKSFFKDHGIIEFKERITKISEQGLVYSFSSLENKEALFCEMEALKEILWFEEIQKVQASLVTYPPNDYNTSRSGVGVGDWNLGKIIPDLDDASDAWDLSSGEDIVVAVLDTGVSPGGSDGLFSLLEGIDFIGLDRFPEDPEKHGTHVSGVIAQKANNGTGRAGVAPESSILPVRVLDEDGVGSTASVSDGVYWAVDHGADLLNLSLGFSDPESDAYSQLLADAIAYAEDQGVPVVAAVGNEGYEDTIAYPAAFDTVIAVGASDKDDEIASFSNQGEEIDFVAPGGGDLESNLYNGIIQETLSDCSFGSYSMEGTSQAAPHVSGVIALILAYARDNEISLSLDDLRTILEETATDLGDEGFDNVYGHGLVQAKEALDYLISGDYVSFKVATNEHLEVLDFDLKMSSLNRGVLFLETSLKSRVDLDGAYFDQSFSFRKKHRIPVVLNDKEAFKISLEAKNGEAWTFDGAMVMSASNEVCL